MKRTLLLICTFSIHWALVAQSDTRTTKVPFHKPPELPIYTTAQKFEIEQNALKFNTNNSNAGIFSINGSLPNGTQPAPSPEGGNSNRFQDVSVNLYTGSAAVPIPLYNLRDGALQVPISLDFNASGIKADEIASWAGLGWSLSAGGMISRMAKDKPDEGKLDMQSGNWSSFDHRKGYLFGGVSANQPVNNDLEPDVFFLNIGGASYKFMYKYDTEARFIFFPDADIKVKPFYTLKSGSSIVYDLVKFEVTMPDGTRYVFGDGAYEKSAEIDLQFLESNNVYSTSSRFNHFWKAESQTSVWYLKKILSPYGQEINIEYNTTNYSFFKLAETQAPNEVCPEPSEVTKTINKVYVQSAVISTITSNNYKVEFNKKFTECVSTEVGEFCFLNTLAPARQDIDEWSQTPQNHSSSKLLLEMMVMDNVSNPTDTLFYNFNYGYFTGATDDLPTGYTASPTGSGLKVGTTHQKRLRLEKVTFPDKTNYRFRYKGDSPFFNGKSRLDMGVDHWGFSNGHTGNRALTGLIPRDGDYPSCTPNTSDRETDASFGFYGNLDSIIVSTGSRIAFEYELHNAANYTDGTSLKPVGGSRIKSLKYSDDISGIETIKKYAYLASDNVTSSGYMVLKPVYRYYRHGTGVNGSNSGVYMRLLAELGRPPVGYSRVIETITDKFNNPLGKTVFHFDQSKQEINFRRPYCYTVSGNLVCDSSLIDILLYEVAPNFTNAPSHQFNTGNLLRKETFNTTNDTLVVNEYQYTPNPIYEEQTSGHRVFKVNGINFGHNFFSGQNYYFQNVNQGFYKYRLQKEIQKIFSQTGTNPLISTTEVFYKDEMSPYYNSLLPGKHNAPVLVKNTDSKGLITESLTKYVADFGGFGLDTTLIEQQCFDQETQNYVACDTTIYTDHVPMDNTEIRAIFEMQAKNMLYGTVESSAKYNDFLNGAVYNSFGKQIISGAVFNYYSKKSFAIDGIGSTFFTDASYNRTAGDTISKDSRYFPIAYITDYNKYGFPTEQHAFGGAIGQSKFDISQTLPAISIFNPNGVVKDSLLKTYSLKIFGLASENGSNGLQTKYDYYHNSDQNKIGQLKAIKDKDNFIVSNYEYPLRGQGLLDSTGSLTTDKTKNRTVVRSPRIATTNANQDFDKVSTSVNYTDGSGRTLQQIYFGQSPSGKDILSGGLEFDSFGRPKKSFLPSPKGNRNGLFENGFGALSTNFYSDTAAYSLVSQYESSQLSRVFKTIGPGAAFRPNKEGIQSLETGNFSIQKQTVSSANVLNIGTYSGNQIGKATSTDENGNKTISFADKEGNTLETWVQVSGDGSQTSHYLITTYLYDYLNRPIGVIPPKLYGQISNGTDFTSSAYINAIYFTKYDSRGRAVEKHVPDGGWTYAVYNRLGQTVLTQNARQRQTNLWEWSKYGARGQNVMSGILTQSTYTREQLQTLFDEFIEEKQYEERSISSANEQHTNRSFPSVIQAFIGANDIKMVNYFDDYAWNTNTQLNFQKYKTDRWPNAKGLMTGSKVRRLDTNAWLASAMYYDDKNRLIQTQSENRFGAINQTDMVMDFIGQLMENRVIYRKPSAPMLTIATKYNYDHAGRKLDASHYFNGREELLATYDYDELGRLISKNLNEARIDSIKRQNPVNDTYVADVAKRFILLQPGTLISGDSVYSAFIASGLQKVSYQYDVRGNLRCVNCKTNGSLDSAKVFAMKLDYFQDGRLYNGLLSKQTWLADSTQRSYLYDYDKANRYITANYTGIGNEKFNENSEYDANGNILKLNRFGKTGTASYARIDSLNYIYPSNSNKLTGVTDLANVTRGHKDNGNATDYTYYPDGSLKTDSNKGITDITYNYLGLPEEIQFGTTNKIKNLYTADGQKLTQLLIEGTDTTRTDYVGGLIYVNDTLQTIFHDEGRVRFDSSGIPHYQYFIQDHLGNNRVIFEKLNDSLFVAQRVDYYPFGSPFEADSLSFRFTYQGKEYIDFFGYNTFDFGWRQGDSWIGRWNAPDPANQFLSMSPYNYMGGNPVSQIDPDGQFVPIVIAGAAILGGASNLWSNWSKVKNWKQGLAYFGSGAVGGVVSLVGSPVAGGSTTAALNLGIDVVTGNIPTLKNGWDVAKYASGLALDGFGVAGAGQLAKGIPRLGAFFSERAIATGGGEALKLASWDGGMLFDAAEITIQPAIKGWGGNAFAQSIKQGFNKVANLNSNASKGNFGIYEIFKDGQLYKYGKADLGRITQSSNLPTRLHQQVRQLQGDFKGSEVFGRVIDDLGTVTTKSAKGVENAYLNFYYKTTGKIPVGNLKSFFPR